jgi:hypothetical protein
LLLFRAEPKRKLSSELELVGKKTKSEAVISQENSSVLPNRSGAVTTVFSNIVEKLMASCLL